MDEYIARIALVDFGKWEAGTILALAKVGTDAATQLLRQNWGDKRWLYIKFELSEEDADKARKRMLKFDFSKIPELQKRQQVENAIYQHHEDFRQANYDHVRNLSAEEQMIYAIGQKVHVDKLRTGGTTALNVVDKAIQNGTNAIRNDTVDKILVAEPLNLVEKVCATRLLKNMYALSERPDYRQYKDINISKVYLELRQKTSAAAHHFRNTYDSIADVAKATIAQIGKLPDVDEVFGIDSLSETPESQWVKEPVEPNESGGGLPKIIILVLFLLAGLLICKAQAVTLLLSSGSGYIGGGGALDTGNPKYSVGLNAFDPIYTVGDDKTYSTIQAAIDAIPDDLSGQGEQTVEIYAGGTPSGDAYHYDENVNANAGFSGASDSNKIVINGMVAHNGLRETGIVVRGETATLHAFQVYEYTEINDISITRQGVCSSNGNTALRLHNNVKVNRVLVYDVITAAAYGHGIWAGSNDCEIINCAVMNCGGASGGLNTLGIAVTQANTKIYNTTVANIQGGASGGVGFYTGGTNITITNCIAVGNWKDFHKQAGTDPIVTYCISSDNTADDWGGAGNVIEVTAADQFENATAGSEDIHLKAGADCIDAGTDLSPTVVDDIIGTARPQGAAYDVGAFEYIFPPTQASNPTPADGAVDVSRTQQLSWDSVADADSYDVYLGTSSPPASQGNQAGVTFNPGTLAARILYYWRIDTVNVGGTTTGIEWSFFVGTAWIETSKPVTSWSETSKPTTSWSETSKPTTSWSETAKPST